MKKLLVPLVALLLGGGFISPVEANPASPREQVAELRAIRARMSGQEVLADPALVLAPEPSTVAEPASAQAPEHAQAPEPVQAPAPAPVVAVAPAPAPVVAVAPAPSPPSTQASRLGGEISLAEAQAQAPSTPPFQPNSSLFGGDKTDVRIEADYQGVPGQTNSKAGMTVAPQGQPFLVQVNGEQTTGTCPAGPGGSCEYDSWNLDVYGAYRFWTPTTEGNVGPFVRFQDNSANGTWRSPDGLYSGSWKSDNTQTDVGLRFRLRHRLDPKSAANPWVGVGGEYDFANGGYDAFGEGGIRPGNPQNPWNLYVQGGVNSNGGYFYPEITTPNLIGDANSKLQVQLQAKGVLYGLGRDNASSRVELGLPLTLNVSHNTAIQVVPAYVLGLDSNTTSGFGASVKLRIGF